MPCHLESYTQGSVFTSVMTGEEDKSRVFFNETGENVSLALLLTDSSEPFCQAFCERVSTSDRLHLLTVTLSGTQDEWFNVWQRDIGGSFPQEMVIVLVGETSRSSSESWSTRSFAGQTEMKVSIEQINDPTDVASLGTLVSNYLFDWRSADVSSIIYLASLTRLIEHADYEKAFQLLSSLRRRLGGKSTMAYVQLDQEQYQEEQFRRFDHLFDSVVIVDEGELTPVDNKTSRKGGGTEDSNS